MFCYLMRSSIMLLPYYLTELFILYFFPSSFQINIVLFVWLCFPCADWVLSKFSCHIYYLTNPYFFFGQNGSCKDIFCPYIDLPFLCNTNASFEICQKQVAGHLEKEQRHGVKLNIGWSCHAEFQHSRSGTIPCHDRRHLFMQRSSSSEQCSSVECNGSSPTGRLLLL